MPLQGNLDEMSLANLIQVNCQEMRSARLTLTYKGQKGEVYFSDGQIVHASVGTLAGADAIYELLRWDAGIFTLETDVPPPEKSVDTPWSQLLLEGMKQLADWQMVEQKAEGAAAPGILEKLRALNGVGGAVIAACDGVVLAADVQGSDGERESAIAVFVGLMAHQISDTLTLGSFNQCVVTLKNKRVLVLEQPDRYVGLWLEENASPAIVGNAAAQVLKG
jgi:predicted regulator of Ras-like GTPase activity (Roadblock/LC7/MglB family)